MDPQTNERITDLAGVIAYGIVYDLFDPLPESGPERRQRLSRMLAQRLGREPDPDEIDVLDERLAWELAKTRQMVELGLL